MANEPRQARVAFIGCGRHATSHLYPCLAQIPELRLMAVCDLNEKLARRNARLVGAERWYTDADELLEKEPKLDGAMIVGQPQMMKALGGEGPASPWGARIRGEASRHQCGPGGGVRLCSRHESGRGGMGKRPHWPGGGIGQPWMSTDGHRESQPNAQPLPTRRVMHITAGG